MKKRRYRCPNCRHTVESLTPPRTCDACGAKRPYEPADEAPQPQPQAPVAAAPPAPAPIAPPQLKTGFRILRGEGQDIAAPIPEPVAPAARGVEREAAPAQPPPAAPAIAAPPTPAPSAPPPRPSERMIWKFSEETGAAGRRQPLRSAPAIDAQGQILVTAQSNLVALVEDGQAGIRVAWRYNTGGYIPGCPALGPDGRTRVHSLDGFLHCIDGSGRPAWPRVRVGEPLGWASPVVDDAGNTWICVGHGGLLRVDAAGRTEPRHFFRSPAKFDCTGLIVDQTFYVGAEDQFLYAIALDGPSGKNRWNQKQNRGRTGWYINSAPLLVGSTIVAVSRDNRMYGFDRDGVPNWVLDLPGQALGSPVADEAGRVFLGVTRAERPAAGMGGALLAVDVNAQTIVWEHATDAPVESTPVVGDDGVVYFGDNAGMVHAVDGTGKRCWTDCVGAPVRSAGVIVSAGHVVFGLDSGDLIALRCDSGPLSRSPDRQAVEPAAANPAGLSESVAQPSDAEPGPPAT